VANVRAQGRRKSNRVSGDSPGFGGGTKARDKEFALRDKANTKEREWPAVVLGHSMM